MSTTGEMKPEERTLQATQIHVCNGSDTTCGAGYEGLTVGPAGTLRVPRDPTPGSVQLRTSSTTGRMEFRKHSLHSKRQHHSEGKIKKLHSWDKPEQAQVTETVHRDKPSSRRVLMLKVWKPRLFGTGQELVAFRVYFFSSNVLFPGSFWFAVFMVQTGASSSSANTSFSIGSTRRAGPGTPVLFSHKTSLPPPPPVNY